MTRAFRGPLLPEALGRVKERMDATMKKCKLKLVTPDYRLKKQIGQGGNSIVWLGEKDSRQYAIKFFDTKNADTDSVARFEREIQFLYENKAPYIVSIYTHGESKGIKYHVTEFYPQTFREIVEKETYWKSMFEHLIRLAESIKYLDEKGFAHRDIKPENILVDEEELVLCDFGIVKCEDSTLTEKGDRLANAYYAAPEQLVKNGANDVTSAADIYALGMIINESFTKTRLDGANFSKIQEKYPFLYELDILVDKMIEFNPSLRPSPVQAYCELRILYENLQNRLEEIYSTLDDATDDSIQINDEICMQVYFANYLLQNKTTFEIDGLYELTWMRNIGYSVNEEVLFYSILNIVYDECKHKVEYEGNVAYKHRYKPLDLENNHDDKALHDEFIKLFAKYTITEEHELIFSKALKYFDSCVDYHARELIDEDGRTFSKIKIVKENLLDAPILRIVTGLKSFNKDHAEALYGNLWDILSVIRVDELPEDDLSWTLKDCSPAKWYEKNDKGFLDYMVKNYALYYEPILTSLNNNEYRIVFEEEGADEFVSQITYDDDGSVLWADIDAVISKMHSVGDLILLTLSEFDVRRLIEQVVSQMLV